VTREATPEQQDAAKKEQDIEADLKAAAGTIDTVVQVVALASTALGAPMAGEIGLGADAATAEKMSKAAEAVKGKAEMGEKGAKAVGIDIKDKIAKAMSNYDTRIAAAQGKSSALKDQARRDTINNQIKHMQNAEGELKTALQEYTAALKAF